MEEITNPKTARMLKPTPKVKNHKKLVIIIIVIILIVGVVLGFYLMKHKNPFPENIRKGVSYPLYYPEKLPEGYKLDKNSVKVENNITFFTLGKGGEKITISEQRSPDQHFDLRQTPGFGEIPSTAGIANVGLINNQYVAVLVTDKTLVNIYGSKDAPRDAVVKTAQSMAENK